MPRAITIEDNGKRVRFNTAVKMGNEPKWEIPAGTLATISKITHHKPLVILDGGWDAWPHGNMMAFFTWDYFDEYEDPASLPRPAAKQA